MAGSDVAQKLVPGNPCTDVQERSGKGKTALPHVLHLRQAKSKQACTSVSGGTGVFSSVVEKLGIASWDSQWR